MNEVNGRQLHSAIIYRPGNIVGGLNKRKPFPLKWPLKSDIIYIEGRPCSDRELSEILGQHQYKRGLGSDCSNISLLRVEMCGSQEGTHLLENRFNNHSTIDTVGSFFIDFINV